MVVKENIRKLSCATVVKLDEDFLKVTVDSEAVIDIPQMEEISEAYNGLLGPDKPFYILTILPNDLNPSKELRDYWRRPERSRRKLAEAIVIKGIAMAIIANFVSRFERPQHRMEYFKNEKEASVWIEKVRSQESRS
jgi:hypothetical protein